MFDTHTIGASPYEPIFIFSLRRVNAFCYCGKYVGMLQTTSELKTGTGLHR